MLVKVKVKNCPLCLMKYRVNKKYGGGGGGVYLPRWKDVRNQLAAPTGSHAGIESKPDSLIFQSVAYSVLNNKFFCRFRSKIDVGLALFLSWCFTAPCVSTCCLALGYFDILALSNAT